MQPPVLIVGAGPVGQLAALLLSKQGIPSVLVDKRLKSRRAPKAHAVNPRTLEICESVGVSATRLRELGASANDAGDVRFVGTLTGPQFGQLPYERQDDDAFADTPFPLSNIPQPVFEDELSAALKHCDNVDFIRGVSCEALKESDDQVTALLLDNKNQAIERSFSYVIAADGAGSGIRAELGIDMVGPESLQDYLMIHFTADLTELTRDRRGVLYFLFEPGVDGVLIAYDQASTWVLMHPLRGQQAADISNDQCLDLINRAVGQPVDAIIENTSHWSMSAQIAASYRKGRVFLAGDAAHRFPPAGGLGLNTGAGDAQNLAWKLAAVLKHQAGAGLLDTYQQERQQVAQTNSDQSLNNSAKIFDLIIAIHGLEPEQAETHYRDVVSNPDAHPDLATAVEAQRPHFDSFNLQLGYLYDSAAICDPQPKEEAIDCADYQPSWLPGAHFPHRWVEVNNNTVPLMSLLSTHTFALLAGPDFDTAKVSEDLPVVQYGKDFCEQDSWSAVTGLSDSGSLLIRPDGHIAARYHQQSDNFSNELEVSMLRILAKED